MSSSLKINFIWTIADLVAILILSLTVQLGQVKDLVSYVSFAATISSLILAILAIAYSVFSGGAVGNTLMLITKSSADLAGTVASLDKIGGDIREAVEEIKVTARHIPEAMGQVSATVEKNLALIGESVKSRSEAIDKPVATEMEAHEASLKLNEIVEKLVTGGSLIGVVGFYVCILSYRTRRPITKEFRQSIPLFDVDYIYGYLVAMSALDVLSLDVVSEVWTVRECVEYDTEEIKLKIKSYMNSKKYSETSTKRVEDAIEKIDKFFS